MSEQINSEESDNTVTITNSNRPPIYADALIDLVPGAFTTKLVFGVQHKSNSNEFDETITVVLPTSAIFLATKQMLVPFVSNESALKHISQMYNLFIDDHLNINKESELAD